MNLSPIPSRLTAPSHRLPRLMRRHPLVFFFLTAFGFTWVYEIVFVNANN